jgi:uncharacterized protein YodC (DUF2158 family)
MRRIGGHFPYRVAIRVPKGAPRMMVADMYRFCGAHSLPYRMYSSLWRTSDLWDYTIWCFANPMDASAFHRKFGGDRITVTDYDDDA